MAILKRSTCDTKVKVLNIEYICPKCGTVKTAIDCSKVIKCEACKCSMIKNNPKCCGPSCNCCLP